MADRFTVRVVVVGMALLALLGVVGIVALALVHTQVPDILQNVTIGTITALGALLAKTSSEPAEPMPVVVQNVEKDPVPTIEAEPDPDPVKATTRRKP